MATTTAKDLLSAPVPVSMRFDGSLFEKLKDSAKRSLRSVNAEVNYRLKASFERELGRLWNSDDHAREVAESSAVRGA
jgi:hypothetical protein